MDRSSADGVITVLGANRCDVLGRVSSYISSVTHGCGERWECPRKRFADLKLVSARQMGQVGYAMFHFRAPEYYLDIALDPGNLAALEKSIQDHCAPTTPSERTLYVRGRRALPLESDLPTHEQVEFRIKGLDDGRACAQVTQALYHSGATIVAHDGILVPSAARAAPPAARLLDYWHIYRAYRDRSSGSLQGGLLDVLGRAGVARENVERDKPKFGITLEPAVLRVIPDLLADKYYTYMIVFGEDGPGMIASATDFLLNWQTKALAANPRTAALSIPGILKSTSRGIGGHGVVILCAASPHQGADGLTQEVPEYFEETFKFDSRMRELRRRGALVIPFISPDKPWYDPNRFARLTAEIVGPNKPGMLCRMFDLFRANPRYAERMDFVELDARVKARANAIHGEQASVVFSFLFDRRENEPAFKDYIVSTLKPKPEWTLTWISPGLEMDTGSFDSTVDILR